MDAKFACLLMEEIPKSLHKTEVTEMKKAEMKVMGKIGVEIAKLAVFWQAVVPWASDIIEYDWNWNEQLVNIVMVAAVTMAGYFCVTNVKNHIAELKAMKEERKNSKKQRGAKAASPVSFCFWILDICRCEKASVTRVEAI